MPSERVAIGQRLPVDLYEQLRQEAFERRIAINSVIVYAVQTWLDNKDAA